MPFGIVTDIEICRQQLEKGEVVALPTETVYGLAGNAFDETAIRKIFQTKGRPAFNPLIVHIAHLNQLPQLARNIPQNAIKLAKHFWPGPLTLILEKTEAISDLITSGKPTVAIRMPNHALTLELLSKLTFPVAAPSANPYTRVSPTSAQHVFDYFRESVTVLDGGPCTVGLESTIVGFLGEQVIVYRKGGVAIEHLEAYVGAVKLLDKDEKAPIAPGMLAKHYSPETRLILTENVRGTLASFIGKKVGVLSFFQEHFNGAYLTKTLSPKKDLNEAAQNLFHYLHVLDAQDLDVIIAERLPDIGLGKSVNDRLARAQKH